MRGLLFWVLSGILFLAAVMSLVVSLLVKDHEKRYLSWIAVVIWVVLILALALFWRAA